MGFTSCGGQDDCPTGTFCKYDVCLPDLGECTTYDDCPGDSYCDADGLCIPYGVPEDVINDPSCQRGEAPDDVNPEEQCSWDGSADSLPDYNDIYTTPLIADLNLDDDPNRLQPSIIFTGFKRDVTVSDGGGGERIGVLRVISGRSCEQELLLGTANDSDDPDRPAYGAQLAVGDLDGDVSSGGHPEIVGLHRTSSTNTYPPVQPIAWEVYDDGGNKALRTKWTGRVCGGDNDGEPIEFGNGWLEFGPGLWDLDDDGSPEVVIDQLVFDSDGCIQNESVRTAGNVQDAVDALYTLYADNGDNHKGAISTVADVDLDGKPELVRYDGIYEWASSGGGGEWSLESYADSWGNTDKGHVAVADFGEFSNISGHSASDPLPEVVVVSANPGGGGTWDTTSTGEVRIMSLQGDVIYTRFIPHTGCTNSDDIQCNGGHGGPPTASDFDGDGQVEFAAAANVFYTVYDPDCYGSGFSSERPGGTCDRDGNDLPPASPADGEDHQDGVLWAVTSIDASSSQTGSSIFDFDGDGDAEAVYRDEENLFVFDGKTGAVVFEAPANSGTGSEYPTIADVDGDFATEIVYGNANGIKILKDPEDLWVSSRPLWSQHAYSITHIDDDATVRKTSSWENNWEVEGLNNFRQNTQGELGLLDLADLTVELQDIEGLCSGDTGPIDLSARVCNRGTNPVQDGAKVAFFSKPDGASEDTQGTKLCEASTEVLLDVGDCTTVTCSAEVPDGQDVFVIVDPDGEIADCHPGNNDGAGSAALCPAIK